MGNSLNRIKQIALQWLFPENLTCNACSCELPPYSERPLCETCASDIHPMSSKICQKCGRNIELTYQQHEDYYFKCKECQEQFVYFQKHRAYGEYDGTLKVLLMGLKYKNQRYQSRYLGDLLCELIRSDQTLQTFDYIVPVPVHFTRRWSRGYNQAELLAQVISRQMAPKAYCDALVRKRQTQKLKNLGKSSRKNMLEQAFFLNKRMKQDLKGKNILLVDDIYTTGATLNACSKVLYECGCEQIQCVTVARGR